MLLPHRRPQLQPLRLAGSRDTGRRPGAGRTAVGGKFGAQLRCFPLKSLRRPPPAAVPEPARQTADQDTKDQNTHQHHKQRQWADRESRGVRTGRERIERNGHRLPVRHSKRDDGKRERNENDGRDNPAQRARRQVRGGVQPSAGRLSRSRISLPVLKNGTHF